MNWPTVKASELMVKRGGSVNPSKYPQELFDLLSIPAFDKGAVEVLKGAEIGSSKSSVEPGDVLLSKIIPHIRRCWVVPDKQANRQIGSGEWIIFRDTRFHSQFLKHYLTSDGFHKQFMNTVAGVGGSLVRARPSFVESIEIPLLPLKEQKRIAAILDKADAIRRKRQQAIDLADQFLRSVFLDMFGDPVTNPKGWEKKTLGEVIKLSSGNGLASKDMDVSGQYDVYGGNGINGQHSEYMFEEPQLVIGRVGVYCGAVHITNRYAWITDNALFIKEYLQRTNMHYLAMLLELMNLNQYAGQAALPLVSGNRIYPLEAMLAPIEMQNEFESIKTKMLASLSVLSQSSNEIDDLFSSLSQRAFKGELTQAKAA